MKVEASLVSHRAKSVIFCCEKARGNIVSSLNCNTEGLREMGIPNDYE